MFSDYHFDEEYYDEEMSFNEDHEYVEHEREEKISEIVDLLETNTKQLPEDVWLDGKDTFHCDMILKHKFDNDMTVVFGIETSRDESHTFLNFINLDKISNDDLWNEDFTIKGNIEHAKYFVNKMINFLNEENNINTEYIKEYIEKNSQTYDYNKENNMADQRNKLSLSEEDIKEMFKYAHSFIIEYQKDGEEFVDYIDLKAGEQIDYHSLEEKFGTSYKISRPIFDTEDFHYTMESIEEGIKERKFKKETELTLTAINNQTKSPISDRHIETAQKTGYVQGVCESVLAFNNDENRKIMSEDTMSILSKKILSEMHVTKDMAQKFANPETYKALEQCVFAPKQEQHLENARSQVRSF